MAKKLSRPVWLVGHVPRAAHPVAAVLPVAALVAAAQVAVRAEAQAAIAVQVAGVADKSQRRCTKNTALPKGNPLKRLK
jgi:hypothetical protein